MDNKQTKTQQSSRALNLVSFESTEIAYYL